MMRRYLGAVVALLVILAGDGRAWGEGGAVTESSEMKAIFSDATMLGYFPDEFGGKDRFTEYHCPNGQSRYIHGGSFKRGIWRVGEGRVCYTYDRPLPAETFCFQLFHDGEGYKLINVAHPEDGFTVFISSRLSGDPLKLQQLDGGACEDLSS
jgi:hypothetical protein